MSDLDPNKYWQRKATYENLSRTIPDFGNLEAGQARKYFDKEGNLHFEVRISLDIGIKLKFGKLLDYIQGEMTSKPSNQIIMESKPHEIAVFAFTALIDTYCRASFNRSINEIVNGYNKVELIDHKTEEIHRFTGSIENKQLKFDVTYKKDSDFTLPSRGQLKYKEGENYSTKFDKFLEKLSPEFKNRFTHEEQSKERF